MKIWLASKLLFSKKSLGTASSLLSLLGLVLGVALLVLAMAIVSGFESTLRDSLSDTTGHIQIAFRKNHIQETPEELFDKITQIDSRVTAYTPFALVEGVLPRRGKIAGIMIEGVGETNYASVLNLNDRIIEGKMSLFLEDDVSDAMIGKGLAKLLGLKAGDEFKVVVPVSVDGDSGQFKRNIAALRVAAILDLGKHDWNERFVITSLKKTQELADLKQNYSGVFLKTSELNMTDKISLQLTEKLGSGYWVRHWRELNENLFSAIAIEKIVIFFVVSLIVFIAAFNIASSLFVNITRRFSDIAILQSIGMNRRSIILIFTSQGVMIGAVGLFFGILLGKIMTSAFVYLQNYFSLIDGSVYKIDGIIVDSRMSDIISICISTLLISFLATLWPALKGSKLNPAEGLRHG